MSAYAIQQKLMIGELLQKAYPDAALFVRELGYTLQIADEADFVFMAVTHKSEEIRFEAMLTALSFLVITPSPVYPINEKKEQHERGKA